MEDERELLRGNTPTLILAALKDGALHGYALAREINRRSNNALQCKQGTLYPALHALEQEGFIVGGWEYDTGQRPRKVYSLTEEGHTELDRRIKTWKQFALAVNSVIGGTPHEQPA